MALNLASAHDTNLITALNALRRYGAKLPGNDAIEVVAVEARDVWTFGERCSAEVEASIPVAVEMGKRLLEKTGLDLGLTR